MLDKLFNLNNARTQGTFEIERRVRARERELAILRAEYQDDVREPLRLTNPFKGLIARLFGGTKTPQPQPQQVGS